ncbi:DUF1885 family protein [Thermoactinomyces sp. DSM 45892]|uniref:DUF1885 family protein n=1 Tax=Thermoactinomyces sp. DSM 45892 TaxID=1882753 RepID=UPI0008988012|nr:DUF1885 family protein [Thermoactinomyces sp. DSM 45892]SDY62300.1 protein of unknown function [Thermoactinomyces sp. DSM 45892]
MKKSTYIRLVKGSTQPDISLDEVHSLLDLYVSRMKKTGEQLDWDYASAAFPYKPIVREENGVSYLTLTPTDTELYYGFWLGVGKEDDNTPFIQIVLPTSATHGDVGKANEYAKFLAKELKGQLSLFNQSVLHNELKK